MDYERRDLTTFLIGRDRARSVWWLKIAAGLLLVACIGFGVGDVVYRTGPVNPEGFVEISRNYISSGLVIVSLLAIVGGILAATVQAYRNDGLGVSVALALAPVIGHSIGYLIGQEVLFLVDVTIWGTGEGGFYVYIFGGLFVLVIALGGFVLGAGARRVRDFVSRR